MSLRPRHVRCRILKSVSRTTLQIQENVSLASFTTLGIGGPARFFVEIGNEDDLIEAVAFARVNHLPLFSLGGGSNLLASDTGFPGLVLHLTLTAPIQQITGPHHVDLHVPAGVDWDTLVLHACTLNLSGMECLAGIPGLTGGAPIQNIGAYGQEVAETIKTVRALDLQTGIFTELANDACRFTYRSSIFNSTARGRFIVTAVTFRLSPDAQPKLTYADLTRHFAGRQPTPLEVYHAVREIRRGKGMLLTPGDPDSRSAGSFFKNPVVPVQQFDDLSRTLNLDPTQIPHWLASGSSAGAHVKLAAAWLLDQAGFHKGFTLGEAGISSRHTLALINRGHATYGDLTALRDRVRSEVEARFGITLEQEPVELGF